jgi:hypothetical protein
MICNLVFSVHAEPKPRANEVERRRIHEQFSRSAMPAEQPGSGDSRTNASAKSDDRQNGQVLAQ